MNIARIHASKMRETAEVFIAKPTIDPYVASTCLNRSGKYLTTTNNLTTDDFASSSEDSS